MRFFFRGKYEESIVNYDHASEIDPNYTLSFISAAVALRNLRQYSVAAQKLEKVKQIKNLSQGERYLRDWLDAALKGDNESKFRIMQQQEKLAPGTANSFQLGLEAIRTNRPQVAIEALARLDPEGVHMKDWIGYWGVLTMANHMIGNHKQELKAVLQAQAQYPESWSPLVYKINALAALGNLSKVYKVLEECKAKPFTDYWIPARLMGIAGEEFRAHRFNDHAAEMFELGLSFLKKRPLEEKSNTYSLALATAYVLNWHEASPIFTDLHESDPENLTYLGSLGLCAAKTGDKKEALRISDVLEKWSEPYIFGAHTFWQAVIAAALGEKDRSVSLLRTSLQQGQFYTSLYCRMELEPLWDYPAFIELIKPRE